MRREGWIVGEHGVRPAGRPDRCFYCDAAVGDGHKPGCVIRSRTVIMKVSFEVIRHVPEDWVPEDIESHMNEGTNCFSNQVAEIDAQGERMGCPCMFGHGEFVREATTVDEESYKMKVAELPS